MSDHSESEETLANVRSAVMRDGGGRTPSLTLLPLPMQPDVVTKYKAAAKIVNGELL